MNLSIEMKTEKAIQLVILDAIEKGYTNPADLKKYMKSKLFQNQVEKYVSLFDTV